MPYLLDTNHCFRLIGRDERIQAVLAERPAARILTSVIVAGELRYGAMISDRTEENSLAVEDFLGRVDQVTISPAVAQFYGDLKSMLLIQFGPKERTSRRRFDLTTLGFTDNDLWIAASALERDAILVTADADFARMTATSSLRVENWL